MWDAVVWVADCRQSSAAVDASIAHQARRSTLAAHGLVRRLGAEMTGQSALTLGHHCAMCGVGDHGKPYFPEAPEMYVSLAHAFPWVAATVAHAPIGVDVEPQRAPNQHRTFDDLYGSTLTAAEYAWVVSSADRTEAFLRLWTRKESLVKLGVVQLDEISSLEVLADAGPFWRLHTTVTPDHVLSYAHDGALSVRLEQRSWC